MSFKQCAEEWRAFDESRSSLPCEHMAVAGLGTLFILSALGSRSGLGATLKALAGGALLVRAASGRDGLCQWMKKPLTPEELMEQGRS